MTVLPRILIIDDESSNLSALTDILQESYRLRIAKTGAKGLEIARIFRPDVILLDIMMPEMDGFEVCRILKASEELKKIPVLFLSALHENAEKVRAFRYGGADYICKPFCVEELQARIKNYVNLHRLHNDLDQQVEEKNKELLDVYERLALMERTKTDFLQQISHDMRTPVNGMINLANLLLEPMQTGFSQEQKEFFTLFQKSCLRMNATLEHVKLLVEIDVSKKKFNMEVICLATLLRELTKSNSSLFNKKSLQTKYAFTGESFLIKGDEKLYRMALTSLIKLAINFSDDGKVICFSIIKKQNRIELSIKVDGHKIDEKYIENFLEVFTNVRSYTHAEELGLEPALAKRIFSLYGGYLDVYNEQDGIAIILSQEIYDTD